jgi:hypothetical protein
MNIIPYEKSKYSQNSEDGIIEVLVNNIKDCKKIFMEIGWGDGTCNMTRNLVEQGWTGVGVDAAFPEPDPTLTFPKDFIYKNIKVIPNSNLPEVFENTPKDVDFFSLDIDSFDYDVSKWMLEHGFRPKVVCLEINPRFGNNAIASMPFKEKSNKKKIYRKTSLFGCSIRKYKELWELFGYEFFGYDSSVTNVFFYNKETVNKIELPFHTLEEFPITTDNMKEILTTNEFWKLHLEEIYSGYKK